MAKQFTRNCIVESIPTHANALSITEAVEEKTTATTSRKRAFFCQSCKLNQEIAEAIVIGTYHLTLST